MNITTIIFAVLCVGCSATSPYLGTISTKETKEPRDVMINSTQKLLEEGYFNCTVPARDCDNHGSCLPDGNCVCNDDYTTYNCDMGVQCCYKRKSRLAAFLLQFFLGAESGAGLWYIGQDVPAGMELMLFLLLIFFGCLVVFCAKRGEKFAFLSLCLAYLTAVTLPIYWLAYLIIIGIGDINDGNGIKISDW